MAMGRKKGCHQRWVTVDEGGDFFQFFSHTFFVLSIQVEAAAEVETKDEKT